MVFLGELFRSIQLSYNLLSGHSTLKEVFQGVNGKEKGMTFKISYKLLGLLAMLTLIIGGCAPGDRIQEEDLAFLEGLITAREAALSFVRAQFGDDAPTAGMVWSVESTTPEGIIGSMTYQFSGDDWVMDITYPVVAPESMIYDVELSNANTGFFWQGQVDAQGRVTEMGADISAIMAGAWLGHISSAAEGSGVGSLFVLFPPGVGELGLAGANEAVETEIAQLRDAVGAEEYVHIWGLVTCDMDDLAGCTLVADRLRYGQVVADPEPIDGWEGVIYNGPPGPRSGGDDYFALVGDFPVQFGVWAADEGMRSRLEGLRDTGTVIRVWGQLIVGIPDWNGTQIQVERFEIVMDSIAEIPPTPDWSSPASGWLTYTNDRYGYQISYPPEASLEEMGIHGYPSDENGMPDGGLPDGVTPETYFDYLEETYGNNLCIQITYALGYLTISVPENEGFRYATCGRTGVGVATITDIEQQVIVDGQTITAKGMDVQAGGETLDQHNETLYLQLPDGTRIEFGSRPLADATYQDYLMKGKPMLILILKTYTSLR